MLVARTVFSQGAFARMAFALAALLTAAGAASARPPLFGRLFPRPAYDPEAYIQNSAVLPAYYWSVSKYDRANAGAFGGYVPPPCPGACPIDATALAQPDDARNVVDPAPSVSSRQP
jgi:hypothetical protein